MASRFRWPSFFPWSRSGGERTFVSLFAFQTRPKAMHTSHTFATFSRRSGDTIRHRTISWMPATLLLEPLRLWAQPGRNLTLEETLRLAERFQARSYGWGPFECTRELYQVAMLKADRLESGEISFVVIDQAIPHWTTASNCIHAVSDVFPDQPMLFTGISHGDSATLQVLDHFSPHLIRPEKTHRWVAESFDVPADSIQWLKAPVSPPNVVR